MGIGENLEGRLYERTNLSQGINRELPVLEFNFEPGKTQKERSAIAGYKWGITQAADAIYYLVQEAIKNGCPYKSFKFNIKVGNLPYKIKGFKHVNGMIKPVFERIQMDEITQGSKPNEYNITFNTQSIYMPPEAFVGGIGHVIGGHGIIGGVNGSETKIEAKVIEAFENTGNKHIANYIRKNSMYV